MKSFTFFLIAVFALTLSACSNEVNYDKMAQEICRCSKPMIELNAQLEAYLETGDIDKATAMVEDIEATGEAQLTCMEAIENKYGTVEGEEAEKLAIAALERNCPEIAAMMNQLEAE